MSSCIAVMTVGGGHFWNEVKKGALQAGKEIDVNIYHRAPIDEANVNGQKKAIRSAIQRGCNGFVIAPNTQEINKIATQFKKQNIPTVYIDRDYGGDRLSIISTNNYLAGKFAGEEMVKALKGKGKVAIFRLSKEIVSTTAREEGFIKAVTIGGLEVVFEKYVGTRVGNAREHSLKILKKMNNIDGIFTPNETTTLGVLINLENLNKYNKIIHIGFDSHKRMIDSLKENNLYGFIVQNPFQMGYQGVHNVYKAMKGHKIDNTIDTKVIFINNDNINNPTIKKMLGLK
jgi:ribose transport system substrate-binding protein